jgi:hypothetical protein
MRCPNCKTPDVARAETVWLQQTHVGSHRSVGIGLGVGGAGVGGGKTKSRTMSLAAAALAPPKDGSGGWLALSILGLPLFLPLITIPLWLRSRRAHKTAMESWKRTWYCQRCGTTGDQSLFDAEAASTDANALKERTAA